MHTLDACARLPHSCATQDIVEACQQQALISLGDAPAEAAACSVELCTAVQAESVLQAQQKPPDLGQHAWYHLHAARKCLGLSSTCIAQIAMPALMVSHYHCVERAASCVQLLSCGPCRYLLARHSAAPCSGTLELTAQGAATCVSAARWTLQDLWGP